MQVFISTNIKGKNLNLFKCLKNQILRHALHGLDSSFLNHEMQRHIRDVSIGLQFSCLSIMMEPHFNYFLRLDRGSKTIQLTYHYNGFRSNRISQNKSRFSLRLFLEVKENVMPTLACYIKSSLI